jgi:Cu+-exporting ATPase
MGLSPNTALVELDNKYVSISIDDVVLGDNVMVKPGVKVPVDGNVIEGDIYIDESMRTAESIPVCKKIGDRLRPG